MVGKGLDLLHGPRLGIRQEADVRYREVIIDGRVFLEIVDEIDERPPGRDEKSEDERRDDEEGGGGGVWIGELVPFL